MSDAYSHRELSPGFGGALTVHIPQINANLLLDTIDCSRCGALAFQVEQQGDSSSTITVLESFDGIIWSGTALLQMDATPGTIAKKSVVDGPFGLIRIYSDGTTTGEDIVKVTGFAWPLGAC